MTNLEYMICEAESNGEIDLDTRNKLLDIITEKKSCEEYKSQVFKKDFLTERLETMILDKKIPYQKMTLYHISEYNLDTIKPCSINLGTRISRLRNSSFWSKDKEKALLWASQRIVCGYDIPYTGDSKSKLIYIPESYKSDYIKTINRTDMFLYILNDVPVYKIGRGQLNIDEYTLDEEVKPTKKQKLNNNALLKYVVFVPTQEFIDIANNTYNYFIDKGTSNIRERLLFGKNGDKILGRRSDLIHKGEDQFYSGNSKHEALCDKDGYESIIKFNIKELKKKGNK